MNNGRPPVNNPYGFGQQNNRPAGFGQQNPPRSQGQPFGQTAYQPRPGYPQQGFQPQQPQQYPLRQPQQPQGYPPQQAAYPPPGGLASQQQLGYTQPNQRVYPPSQQPGYQQAQQAFGQAQQQAQQPRQPNPGQYSPQANYPYQQGYQNYQPPVNSYGGYPQQKPPRKAPDVKPETLVLIMLCGVLPVLFILGLVFGGVPALKWIFAILAVATVAVLWIRPMVATNVRLTFTAVYAALAVIALVTALTGGAPADPVNPGSRTSGGTSQTTTQTQQTVPAAQQQTNTGANNLGTWATEQPRLQVTPAPANDYGDCGQQLESFFYFWKVNNVDNMLTLCSPEWKSTVKEPAKALCSILQLRIPIEYSMEAISGTANSTARTITVVATISKQNNREPEKYRFQVLMVKENETWYIDPESLESNEKEEATEVPNYNLTNTPPPTAIKADPDTRLYFNPDGGTYYHATDNCTTSTNKKYLPFKGSFLYKDIGNEPYKELKPCLDCGAPLRP